MLKRAHIRAPKTHDPGGGRPKEHLAYINRQEAEMLRILTDGTVEKGPKGIPSYAISVNGSVSGGAGATKKATGSVSVSRPSIGVSGSAKAGAGVSAKAPAAAARPNNSSVSQRPTSSSLNAPARTAPSQGSPVSQRPSGISVSGSAKAGVGAAAKAPAATAPVSRVTASPGARPATAPPTASGASPVRVQQPAAPRALGGIGSPVAPVAPVTPPVSPLRPSQNMQRPASAMSGRDADQAASAMAGFGQIGAPMSPPSIGDSPISLSNQAAPAFKGITNANPGNPAFPSRPPAPISMTGPADEASPFSKKGDWQTKKNASVMGSKNSVKALDVDRLGLPPKASSAMKAAVDPQTSPAQSLNYLDKAAEAIGLNEGSKKAALQEYLRNGGMNLDPATTAWCAAFVNATLKQVGLEGTGRLNARSYLDYGTPTDNPREGDIAVFSRGNPNGWQGHVGFYKGVTPDGKYVQVLGGNQDNSVSVKNYPVSRLLGYRQVPGAQPVQVAQGPVPRPVPRPDDLRTGGFSTASERRFEPMSAPAPSAAPIPRPTPRPPQAGLDRNPYDVQRTEGVPRARPAAVMQSKVVTDPRAAMQPGYYPAAAPERLSAPETYVDPSTGLSRNAFDTQRAVGVPRARPPVELGPMQGPSRPVGGMSFTPGLPGPMAQTMVVGDPRAAMRPGSFPAAPSPPDNSREVAPGHWKREEDNYLIQSGAMRVINEDPAAKWGYRLGQNPDGSGLMLEGDTGDPKMSGWFDPNTGRGAVNVDQSPQMYGAILGHELGHQGSDGLGTDIYGPAQEELRQRMVDQRLHSPEGPTGLLRESADNFINFPQLRGSYSQEVRPGMGMSFTPALPGPQKVSYDRLAQEQGPQQPYQIPDYPGRVASGTYTASYDAPRPRGPALRGIDKLTELPPGYAERYGLNKPAAPAPDAPAGRSWLEAVQENVGGFQQAAEQKVAEVQQQISDAEKKYGKITPGKIKLALLWNQITNGGGGGKASAMPERQRDSGDKNPKRRRIALPARTAVAAATAPAPAPVTPEDWSYFNNVVSREEALRRLLGEEWYA